MKNLVYILLYLLISPTLSASARTALVIGNSEYEIMPQLINPAHDAEDISKKLESLGFEVFYETNQSQSEFENLITKFGDTLKQKGGVGLVYYAGHGIQVDGQNYLISVDFDYNNKKPYQVPSSAISMNLITGALKEANNPLNIIILDACRNNPIPSRNRALSQGLAPMDSASGTIIAYSTGPGEVAADGDGRNSPYTSHLLKHMGTTGLTIEQVFKKVRVDVENSTMGYQLPWETSSLRGDFYFSPAIASSIASSQQDKTTVVAAIQSVEQAPVFVLDRKVSSSINAKKLSIFTNPENSIVSILNSAIPYSMGVKLDPGDYRVEISKEGYRTKKQWISIDKDNMEIQITLVPNS